MRRSTHRWISNIPVDREHSLPYNYKPDDLVTVGQQLKSPFMKNNPMMLRKKAHEAFKSMILAARRKGLYIGLTSCYRSAEYQEKIYSEEIDRTFPKQRLVAKPTTSEHQLGTAADVSSAEVKWLLVREFDETDEFQTS